MRIQRTGNEKDNFLFLPMPEEHVEKVKIAINTAKNIIHACKQCRRRDSGKIGLHKAFENLIHKNCGRIRHTQKSLDQLLEDVWVSWIGHPSIFGFCIPCYSTDEIAFATTGVKQSHLHMAGTIIHELAHLCSADTDPNSHQAESVLSQCCKLESVYHPLILGKTSSLPAEIIAQQCIQNGMIKV